MANAKVVRYLVDGRVQLTGFNGDVATGVARGQGGARYEIHRAHEKWHCTCTAASYGRECTHKQVAEILWRAVGSLLEEERHGK